VILNNEASSLELVAITPRTKQYNILHNLVWPLSHNSVCIDYSARCSVTLYDCPISWCANM